MEPTTPTPNQPTTEPTPAAPPPTPPSNPAPTVVQPTVVEPTQVQSAPPTSATPPTTTPLETPASTPATPATLPPAEPAGGKRSLKTFLVPILAAVLLLLGGGAVAINQFVINSPENVWKKALDRTADGMDSFIGSLKEENSRGGSLSGKVSIEAPVAADGKIEGKWYEANSELSGEIGFSGLRFVADIRTIQVEGETFPDVYVNATGLDDVAAFVAPEIASLLARAEGNWVKIDRTLLAQRQLEADAEDGTPEITLDDAKEFADRTAKVLRERLFTTDESKAVVQMEEFLGKEDFKGRAANKYKVRVNKENLKAFVDAYVAEIEDTKIIQQYIAQMPEGTTVQEAFDLDELKKSIDEVDESKAMATAWVDTGYSLLRNVRLDLSDNDATTYLDLGLAYAGGDELPFEMILSGDDEQGNIVISLGANFNQKTRATLFTATADGEIDAQKIKLDAELKLTPSDEVITPVAPTGAINVFELFGVDPSLLEAPSGSLEGSDLFFDDIQL